MEPILLLGQAFGSFGAILLALCGLPLAYQSYKKGHSNDINMSFLYMWISGEILSVFYLFTISESILIWNYIANIIFLSVILYYKIKPRKK